MRSVIEKLKTKKLLVISIGISLACLLFILSSINKKPIESNLKPINIYPPAGISVLVFPQTAIVFTFSAPIEADQLKVNISPNIPTKTKLNTDHTQFIVSPTTSWKIKQPYQITLSKIDGTKILDQEITFISPKDSPEFEKSNADEPPGGI